MHRHFAGLVAAMALMTSSAIADGMNTRGSIKDSVQPFSWRGFYVGLHAGLATGNTQGEVDIGTGISTDYDLNGAIYGGQVGWLGQWGNVVAGIEGTYSGTSLQGNTGCGDFILLSFDCKREVNWIATAVGRVGYAFDRVLVYGLGGVAWADVDTNVAVNFLGAGAQVLSANETHVGWTAGFGLEWALTDRVSARIEYAHINLGDETHQLRASGVKGSIPDKVELEVDTIRLGVNVKLGH
jgi:outer membrane immunogenic protein